MRRICSFLLGVTVAINCVTTNHQVQAIPPPPIPPSDVQVMLLLDSAKPPADGKSEIAVKARFTDKSGAPIANANARFFIRGYLSLNGKILGADEPMETGVSYRVLESGGYVLPGGNLSNQADALSDEHGEASTLFQVPRWASYMKTKPVSLGVWYDVDGGGNPHDSKLIYFAMTTLIDAKQTSDDQTFGYTIENPVKLGSADNLAGPVMSRLYLRHLRDSHFNSYTIDGTRAAVQGTDGHLVDRYTLIDSEGKQHVVYIDMYHPGNSPLASKAPMGMYLWINEKGANEYNFNGRWHFSESIDAHKGDWTPWLGIMTASQESSAISLTFPDGTRSQGTCDPANEILTVRFTVAISDGTQTCEYTGKAADEETLSGTSRCSNSAGNWADSAWTGVLISR